MKTLMNRLGRSSLLLAFAGYAICALAPASAQTGDFPNRPITMIVPFAAASGSDQIARAIAQGITDDTKTTVVVEDKPGASGFIGAQAAATAKPDGYTIFVTSNTTQAANQHLFKSMPYDPVTDFAPLTSLGLGGLVMVVSPSLPVKNVEEFIALAKSKPGKLTFGSGSSSARVGVELFKQMTGTDILHVPYRSNPFAVTDLLGGQIDLLIIDMLTTLPHIKAGKLKALGVSTRERSSLLPDVPTIAEAGVKGYELTFWFAAYAPAGTPADVVAKLNKMLVKAAHGNAASKFYTMTGTEVFTSTPEELRDFQAAEALKWGRVIKGADIEPQ